MTQLLWTSSILMAPTSHFLKVWDTIDRTLRSNNIHESQTVYGVLDTILLCHRLRCAIFAGFGTHDNEGDVDFFPNGGEHQPGCTEDPGSSALYNLLHGGLGNIQLINTEHSHQFINTRPYPTTNTTTGKPLHYIGGCHRYANLHCLTSQYLTWNYNCRGRCSLLDLQSQSGYWVVHWVHQLSMQILRPQMFKHYWLWRRSLYGMSGRWLRSDGIWRRRHVTSWHLLPQYLNSCPILR